MNKSYLTPLALLLLAVFLSADAFAQGRRGQQGNQSGNRQSNQQANGQQRGRGQSSQTNQSSRNGNQQNRDNALTANQQQGLALLREEEKLARDVYTAMHAKWNDNVFASIAQAESRHLNAVGNLLSKYGIPDPIKNNAAGVFTAPQFQQLYKTLVASGSNSLEDALKVGLKIEEMDIADLRVAIQSTNNQDITRVLENLLRGSRNHLRAFASRLNAVGGTYVATSLPQADFNRIASSQQETGRDNGQQGGQQGGRGNGQGQNGQGQNGRGQNGQGQNGRGRGQGGQQGNGNVQGRGNRNGR